MSARDKFLGLDSSCARSPGRRVTMQVPISGQSSLAPPRGNTGASGILAQPTKRGHVSKGLPTCGPFFRDCRVTHRDSKDSESSKILHLACKRVHDQAPGLRAVCRNRHHLLSSLEVVLSTTSIACETRGRKRLQNPGFDRKCAVRVNVVTAITRKECDHRNAFVQSL